MDKGTKTKGYTKIPSPLILDKPELRNPFPEPFISKKNFTSELSHKEFTLTETPKVREINAFDKYSIPDSTNPFTVSIKDNLISSSINPFGVSTGDFHFDDFQKMIEKTPHFTSSPVSHMFSAPEKQNEFRNEVADSKDAEIAHLKEALEREIQTRRLYDEGKDELIFELEQKLSKVAEELAHEKNKPQSNDFFREQFHALSKEVENLRNQIHNKDAQINDIERKYKVASELLEGESNNWKFLLDEKEQQMEDLNKQLNDLLVERKQWAQFESVKNDLMKEAEERVSQAIITLEQERSHRNQLEALYERMNKSYKESVDTIQNMEKELETKDSLISQLENELVKFRQFLQVEKDNWIKEKVILLDKVKEGAESFPLRDQVQSLQSTLSIRNKEIERLREEFSTLKALQEKEKNTATSLRQFETENQRFITALTKEVASLKEQLKQSEEHLKKTQEKQVVHIEEMKQQLRDVISRTKLFEQELLVSFNQESKVLKDKNIYLSEELENLSNKHIEALEHLKEAAEVRESEEKIRAKVEELIEANEALKHQYDTLQKENQQLQKQIQLSASTKFLEKSRNELVAPSIQAQKGKIHQETEALLKRMNETLGKSQNYSNSIANNLVEKKELTPSTPQASKGLSYVDSLFSNLNFTPKTQKPNPTNGFSKESPSTPKMTTNDLLGQLKFSKLLNTPTSQLTSKRNITSSRDVSNYNRFALEDVSNKLEKKMKPKITKTTTKPKTTKATRPKK